MIDHGASGIRAARAGTRIDASLIHTRPVVRTLWIDRTLWTAIWWCADVICKAATRRTFADDSAIGIRSTRRWDARIDWIARLFNDWFVATREWISGETRHTTAYRIVIDDLTIFGQLQRGN